MTVQAVNIKTYNKLTESGDLSKSRGNVLKAMLESNPGLPLTGRQIANDYINIFGGDLFNISRGIYGRLGELVEMGLIQTDGVTESKSTGMPEMVYKVVDPLPETVKPLQKKRTKGETIKALAINLNWAVAAVQKKVNAGAELSSSHAAWLQGSKQLLNEVYNGQNNGKQ